MRPRSPWPGCSQEFCFGFADGFVSVDAVALPFTTLALVAPLPRRETDRRVGSRSVLAQELSEFSTAVSSAPH